MSMMLDGRVVLVTGAARGLGRAHACAAASQGARVVVNDTTGANDAVEYMWSQGFDAIAVEADVSTWAGAAYAVAAGVERWGRFDGLVNNAGVLRREDAADLTEANVDLQMLVNVRATLACTHHASAYWRNCKRLGEMPNASVVHTTSDSAMLGAPGAMVYSATKAAIIALAQSASLEGAYYGVRHNAVAPSGRTEMQASSGLFDFGGQHVLPPEEQDPDAKDNPSHNSPLVVWLLSARSSHVTGQIFQMRHGAFARVRPAALEGWIRPARDRVSWDVERISEAVDSSVFGSRFPRPLRHFPDRESEPFGVTDHG
jgi:NAD(P)-dependent dehydrogenase (short-subunit alcohol dehydrogenase family)